MRSTFAIGARRRLLPSLALLLTVAAPCASEEGYEKARQRMMEAIEEDVRRTRDQIGRHRLSPAVGGAMESVPRHEFVPEGQRRWAYANRPLSIGRGQTISQPYIVALMSELLDVSSDSVVLEVGTGSGYQAAVLAEMVEKVYTIEIIEELAKGAAARLERLGYENVEVRYGDGYEGWPEHAPFDGIIVTAGAEHVPEPLLEQLAPGGTLVIPVGRPLGELKVVKKAEDGTLTTESILPVSFVPLTRKPR